MTQTEIRSEAYEGTNGEYLYDGHTSEQWVEIAREHDYEQRDSAEQWRIVAVLDGLND